MAPPKGFHPSQAAKDKMSAAQRKRKPPSAKTRRRMSDARKGFVMPPETKAKIAAAMHLYRLAHPEFAPARGARRSQKDRRRQSKFMKGNQYAYKPHLHMSQEEMKKGFDAYVKEHGEKPYPVISHPVVLTREQIQALTVPLVIMPKPLGRNVKNKKGHPAKLEKE